MCLEQICSNEIIVLLYILFYLPLINSNNGNLRKRKYAGLAKNMRMEDSQAVLFLPGLTERNHIMGRRVVGMGKDRV